VTIVLREKSGKNNCPDNKLRSVCYDVNLYLQMKEVVIIFP